MEDAIDDCQSGRGVGALRGGGWVVGGVDWGCWRVEGTVVTVTESGQGDEEVQPFGHWSIP